METTAGATATTLGNPLGSRRGTNFSQGYENCFVAKSRFPGPVRTTDSSGEK